MLSQLILSILYLCCLDCRIGLQPGRNYVQKMRVCLSPSINILGRFLFYNVYIFAYVVDTSEHFLLTLVDYRRVCSTDINRPFLLNKRIAI